MRLILKESQIKTILESDKSNIAHLKNSLFKYWDISGPSFDRSVFTLFGISYGEYDYIVAEWLIEWHGGIDVVRDKLSKYEDKELFYDDFGISFKYTIDEFYLGEEESGRGEVIYRLTFCAYVDGGGHIDAYSTNGIQHPNIYLAFENEDENDSDLNSVFVDCVEEDVFHKILTKYGVFVNCESVYITEPQTS